MATMRAQRGMTLLGFIAVAAMVMAIALIGFRMVPAYIEFFSVQKALEGALREANPLSAQEVRRLFDRRISADYVDSIYAKDVEISKDGNQMVAAVSWQRKLPLVANVSLVIDFDATARR